MEELILLCGFAAMVGSGYHCMARLDAALEELRRQHSAPEQTVRSQAPEIRGQRWRARELRSEVQAWALEFLHHLGGQRQQTML